MFDFDKVVDRHGTWCTQWDYIADRFGRGDLQPFTISDMDTLYHQSDGKTPATRRLRL